MRKKLFHIIKSLLLAGLILNFVAACGGSSSSTVQTVSGTASGGAALTGNITLKDAKGAVKTVAIGNGGAYSIPVDGLSAPFLISAGSYFSLATAPGVTNVNPFTTLAIAGAAGTNDIGAIFNASTMDSAKLNSIANGLNTAVTNINTQLASVYGKYNLSTSQQDFMNSSIAIDRGIDSLFSLLKVQVASTGITVALASSPSTTLFSSDTKGSVTVPNTILTQLPASLPSPPVQPTTNSGSGTLTLSGTGSSAVGTSFTPSKSTYFTEPVGPFGSVVFENDTLVLIANLAKDTATSKYVVTGLNFSTVALTNYSPNYEWDSVDPATITLTTPASMTALPGVSINTTTKQVVFTNVTLNNLSSINPKAGTITINGTVGW